MMAYRVQLGVIITWCNISCNCIQHCRHWDRMIAYGVHTVGCHYNMIQYIMLLFTALQILRQYINDSLNSQQTPHISPSQMSYGMFVDSNLDKMDCIQTALYYIMVWCYQATSCYLNQSWPSFMLPYVITRPQPKFTALIMHHCIN